MATKDEKGSVLDIDQVVSVSSIYSDDADDENLQDLGTDDPFPANPDASVEAQFTFRAVFVGCALGAVISASKYVVSTYVED